MKAFFYSIVFALFVVVSAAAQTPFRQEGIASWYGEEFAGKPTASGEIFDPALLTAAHPSLPLGTNVRVTNTQNGKTVTVRVNDRGPFVAARIIDVSKAAAAVLDMIATGTAPVLVEAVSSGTTVAVPPTILPAAATAQVMPVPVDPASGKRYRLQVGSYRRTEYAAEAFERLKAVDLAPAYERHADLYRVVIAEVSAAEVAAVAEKIARAGFAEVLAREIPATGR